MLLLGGLLLAHALDRLLQSQLLGHWVGEKGEEGERQVDSKIGILKE